MGRAGKWITTAIGAFIGTAIVTVFTWDWALFPFAYLFSIFFTRLILWFLLERKFNDHILKEELQKSFVVSEYYARMEKAQLEILESQEPVSQVIVLWWGLDGIRLNEDGTSEWISRKKKQPVQSSVFYQHFPTYYPSYIGTPSFAIPYRHPGFFSQYGMSSFSYPLYQWNCQASLQTEIQNQIAQEQIENLSTKIKRLEMQAEKQAQN